MLPTYQIFVDGLGYAGESAEVESAQPGFHNGWTGHRPREVNGLVFGEPRNIIGLRCLTSHVDRIMRRAEGYQEIVIRRIT